MSEESRTGSREVYIDVVVVRRGLGRAEATDSRERVDAAESCRKFSALTFSKVQRSADLPMTTIYLPRLFETSLDQAGGGGVDFPELCVGH